MQSLYLPVPDAPDDLRVARAMSRDGRDEKDIRARIAAQFPLSEKLKVATHVIENGGDRAATKTQVDALIVELRTRFQ